MQRWRNRWKLHYRREIPKDKWKAEGDSQGRRDEDGTTCGNFMVTEAFRVQDKVRRLATGSDLAQGLEICMVVACGEQTNRSGAALVQAHELDGYRQ